MASFGAPTTLRRNPIVNNPAHFSATQGTHDDAGFIATPKSDQEKAVLIEALMQNFVFSALSEKDLLGVVGRMTKTTASAGEEIIRQGDDGNSFYVLHSGAAEILVDGNVVGRYAAGSSFGELALLYSTKRAATIRALEPCVLWSINMQAFHRLTIKTRHAETQSKVAFLKKVPLLEDLRPEQLSKIADAMQHVTFPAESTIITEGEIGDEFYIIESGEVKCTHERADGEEQVLLRLGRGDYFGEMALMLDEPRHANVVATTPVVACYHVSRHNFVRLFGQLQQMLQQQMRIRILKSVPLLSDLEDGVLDRLADAMRIQVFRPGKYVVKQGERGSRFYIINDGAAKVTKDVCDAATGTKTGEEDVGVLTLQAFFGERALINKEARAANVIATEQLECLVLDRDTFKRYLANASRVRAQMTEPPPDGSVGPGPASAGAAGGAAGGGGGASEAGAAGKEAGFFLDEASAPRVEDLQRFATLGTGTFGRVSLCIHGPTERVYALKAMQKEQIISSHQERNIMNEKNLLIICRHRFVLGLAATYQDSHSIYMLMELVQGGELWSLIYEKHRETATCRSRTTAGFDAPTAMFYTACVVSAFCHVHAHGVAYRDLKPENLLVDDEGYLKIIDFGFAKRIPWDDAKTRDVHDKTFTICGTPEYLAPEIIQSKGHDKAVDYWALGCLVYELAVGRTPFVDDQQPQIFRKILSATKILSQPGTFPRGADDDAFKDFVAALLQPVPAYRLGAGRDEIKDHKWFADAGFDWNRLEATTLTAPCVPKIRSRTDASNFDPYEEDDTVAPFTGNQSIFADWSKLMGDAKFPPRRA